MKRLRDLGLGVGQGEPGPHNAIVDVAGVGVGQARISEGDLFTGITVVAPYPAHVEKRRLFVGYHALDAGNAMTGVGVGEDFGTFSSPIVLAPAPAVGRLYDAVIQHGMGRDPGLSTYAGWPPVVIGVDDTWWNAAAHTHRAVREEHLLRAFRAVGGVPVAEGNAGIGCGLCAFGFKGGIGTASRIVKGGEGGYAVGALVAANGGAAEGLCVDRYPLVAHLHADELSPAPPQSFAAVLATDAPLIPGQLGRLAGRAVWGLVRVGLADSFTREGVALAFSTTGIVQEAETKGAVEAAHMVGEEVMPGLFAAAAEACEEAVFNALLAAEPVEGGRRPVATLPLGGWPEAVREYQGGRRRYGESPGGAPRHREAR